MATLSLHNWLLSSTGPGANYKDNCPEKPDFILPLSTQGGNRTPENAQEMRNSICDFFEKVKEFNLVIQDKNLLKSIHSRKSILLSLQLQRL